jgi:hypothetical protein
MRIVIVLAAKGDGGGRRIGRWSRRGRARTCSECESAWSSSTLRERADRFESRASESR